MGNRGTRVRQALLARGVTKQQALAAELNVHESAITRWKDGKAMSLDSAIALSQALNLSLDWLLLGRGDMDLREAGADPSAPSRSPELDSRVSAESTALLVELANSIARDVAPKDVGADLR